MDNLILHAMADRSRYRSLRHALPQGMLSPDTQGLLGWYPVYFDAFPGREVIDPEELKSLVRLRAGNATPEQLQLTMHLIDQLKITPDETAINGVLSQIYALDLSGRAAALLARWNDGAEINLAFELQNLAQGAVRQMAAASPFDYIETPIGDLLNEVSEDKGLKFRRWACTREHILGLQGGSSIAIAARPDKGKTSMIADIITDFAPQVVQMYGGDRPILWLNNEGSGKRIIPRIYQAALKMDLNEIIALSNRNELVPRFVQAIGGVPDLIRVKDMHGASLAQIEQVIESQRPAVVIGDMMANFRLGGASNGANKADMVEQIWQEWREILVRYDAVGLGTVQISQEGGNMLYPPYSALKDSKTGIQGAVDIILMLGSLDNADFQTMRGLSSPKNKFAVPGKPSCFQSELWFDGSKCAFDDGSVVTPGG